MLGDIKDDGVRRATREKAHAGCLVPRRLTVAPAVHQLERLRSVENMRDHAVRARVR